MNAQTERFVLAGPAGHLQAVRDRPEGAPRGTAVIAHPHPLHGGTMDNKVVQTLARAFVQGGWTAVRFNFRGVGNSEGAWDEGRGELLDMQAVVREAAADGPIALAGFSFGAFVATRLVEQLWEQREIAHVILVGTATSRFAAAELPGSLHDRSLVVHGEQDEVVPLASVLDWARPQSLPVTVVPGVGHFFHGQLTLLKSLVVRHLH